MIFFFVLKNWCKYNNRFSFVLILYICLEKKWIGVSKSCKIQTEQIDNKFAVIRWLSVKNPEKRFSRRRIEKYINKYKIHFRYDARKTNVLLTQLKKAISLIRKPRPTIIYNANAFGTVGETPTLAARQRFAIFHNPRN